MMPSTPCTPAGTPAPDDRQCTTERRALYSQAVPSPSPSSPCGSVPLTLTGPPTSAQSTSGRVGGNAGCVAGGAAILLAGPGRNPTEGPRRAHGLAATVRGDVRRLARVEAVAVTRVVARDRESPGEARDPHRHRRRRRTGAGGRTGRGPSSTPPARPAGRGRAPALSGDLRPSAAVAGRDGAACTHHTEQDEGAEQASAAPLSSDGVSSRTSRRWRGFSYAHSRSAATCRVSPTRRRPARRCRGRRCRRHRARRDAAGRRWLRRLPPAPPLRGVDAGPDAHRAERGCGPDRGPRRRCRRLPPEAVRLRRASGAAPGAGTSRPSSASDGADRRRPAPGPVDAGGPAR